MGKSLALIFCCWVGAFAAQSGSTRLYSFLDIPMTSRAAGLGGNNMPVWGDDINLVYSNPALLNPSMHKQAALNYCNYVGDLNLWHAAYAHNFENKGTGAVSLQAFDYGKFAGYDEFGNKTNDFRAADYSLNTTWAKAFGDSTFNIGASLKTIISQYEAYQSFGNAIDFGVAWHTKNKLTLSVLARNIGYIWKTYNPAYDQHRNLPQDWQIGLHKKLDKAPFSIMVVYNQLFTRNLSYVSPLDTLNQSNTLNLTEAPRDSSGFEKFTAALGKRTDNFMRHVILGTEIYLSRNFILRVAYNYRRQREMTLTERRGMNAFSFGFTMRIKRFGFSYAFAKMAFGGNSNVLNVTYTL